MASSMQWTWTWANSGRWWGQGRPGMLQSKGSQSIGHNWVTEQRWQRMGWFKCFSFPFCSFVLENFLHSHISLPWLTTVIIYCYQYTHRISSPFIFFLIKLLEFSTQAISLSPPPSYFNPPQYSFTKTTTT